MTISENLTGIAPGIIFAIIFGSLILYLLMLVAREKRLYRKMKRAQRLIEEGHSKAMHGRKDDGIYQETKRQKYDREVRECQKKAAAQARRDLELLQ